MPRIQSSPSVPSAARAPDSSSTNASLPSTAVPMWTGTPGCMVPRTTVTVHSVGP